MRLVRLVQFLAVLLALVLGGRAGAHDTSNHLLSLSVQGAQLSGSWDVTLADLDAVLKLNQDADPRVSDAELVVGGQRVRDYLLSHLKIESGGRPCPLTDTRMQAGRAVNGPYLRLRLAGTCPTAPQALSISNTLFSDTGDRARHRGYYTLTAGGQTQTGVFEPGQTRAEVSLARPSAGAELARFIWLGTTHIWSGLDHVLFLITLLLPAVWRWQAGRWQPVGTFREAFWSVLKVVTAFTLAHSVTLALSALGVISLPAKWVEATIAVSVVFAALNNLFPVVGDRWRWALAFGFGLIHGFGFSSALGELVSDRSALLLSLLGFNLGVEVGQLAIVLGLVPLIYLLRATPLYRRVIYTVASAGVALVAAVWFMQRVAA